MFTAAPLVIAQTWKPKCLATGEQINCDTSMQWNSTQWYRQRQQRATQVHLYNILEAKLSGQKSAQDCQGLEVSLERRGDWLQRHRRKPPGVMKTFYTFFFFFLRAAPEAYGGSQARDRIGAVAARLHHSCSKVRSKLRLQPTAQLMATLDP